MCEDASASVELLQHLQSTLGLPFGEAGDISHWVDSGNDRLDGFSAWILTLPCGTSLRKVLSEEELAAVDGLNSLLSTEDLECRIKSIKLVVPPGKDQKQDERFHFRQSVEENLTSLRKEEEVLTSGIDQARDDLEQATKQEKSLEEKLSQLEKALDNRLSSYEASRKALEKAVEFEKEARYICQDDFDENQMISALKSGWWLKSMKESESNVELLQEQLQSAKLVEAKERIEIASLDAQLQGRAPVEQRQTLKETLECLQISVRSHLEDLFKLWKSESDEVEAKLLEAEISKELERENYVKSINETLDSMSRDLFEEEGLIDQKETLCRTIVGKANGSIDIVLPEPAKAVQEESSAVNEDETKITEFPADVAEEFKRLCTDLEGLCNANEELKILRSEATCRLHHVEVAVSKLKNKALRAKERMNKLENEWV